MSRHLKASCQNTSRSCLSAGNSPGTVLGHERSGISQGDQHSGGLDRGTLHRVYPSSSYQTCYSNTADQHLSR